MPFRRAWRRIVATLVLLALSGMAWAAAQTAPPPAVLGDDTAALSLTPYLSYYHDASAVDDADDAWRLSDGGKFAPVPAGKTAFGFQPGAFWFHATIDNRNATQPYWMLVQSFALLDRIDVYVRYADGRIVHMRDQQALPTVAPTDVVLCMWRKQARTTMRRALERHCVRRAVQPRGKPCTRLLFRRPCEVAREPLPVGLQVFGGGCGCVWVGHCLPA